MMLIPPQMDPAWGELLASEFQQLYMQQLAQFVAQERKLYSVYPPKELVFNAFLQTPPDKVRVVIMGQDPYHGPGQAHGLSFSVPPGIEPPPSLKNIYKELKSDLGIETPSTGCLIPWAHQGVLLLNATLTVREGEPKSHYGKGWERFTDAVIRTIAGLPQPVVFLLWGRSAADKCEPILAHSRNHLILKAPHPSPLSAHAGFFGCRHFSQTNEQLEKWGLIPINWNLFI
jgi:uracil-DNA glycosylase